MIPALFLMASVMVVTVLKWVPVSCTPVMLKRSFQFRHENDFRTHCSWVPIEEVSPWLAKAVIASEDQKFMTHHGFDFQAVRDMLESHRNNGTKLRGCSTISQQVAKNVFTFGTRTIVRKIEEAYWTCLIEIIWGKRRILEVYLNVVEWGCGIYGAEAAAQEYFRSNASDLSPSRAAAMAVCLPLPLIESPDKLSPSYEKRCERIIKQLNQIELP